MKNIILKSLFRITHKKDHFYPCGGMFLDDSYEYYRKMQDLSIQSIRANLVDPCRFVELGGTFDSLQDAFIYTFNKTREIWLKHAPCNILYVDPDVLFLRPVYCFSKPIDLEFHLYGANNCGMRYFSANMSENVWNIMIQKSKQWDHSRYDYEQDMYIEAEQYCLDHMHDPHAPLDPDTDHLWGHIKQQPCVHAFESECKDSPEILKRLVDSKKFVFSDPIVHFHSSRFPKALYYLMEKTWNHARNNR